MTFVRNIPNFITLGNLLFGCLAIYFDNIWLGAAFIVGAAVLDFFDGLFARLLNTSSPLGKELDSLADLISFGLAPAILLQRTLVELGEYHHSMLIFPFAMTLAAAWRLARFNIDTEQTYYFKGIPAPANGLFWVGVLVSIQAYPSLQTVDHLPWICEALVAFTSLMMISKLALLSFKFKNFRWQDNSSRFTIIFGAILLAGICFLSDIFFVAIPLTILLYIAISLTHFYIFKKQ